jgi:MFS family permease
MATASIMFGIGGYFKNVIAFYIVEFFARFLQGVADSVIIVSIQAILAIEFPKTIERYMGYLEMAMGVGLTLGPIIASSIFRFVGYTNTFFFFAIFIFLFGQIPAFFLPKRLNYQD